MKSVNELFDLSGRVAIITGGGGLLGRQHAEAIAEMRGIPALFDIDPESARKAALGIEDKYSVEAIGLEADVTDRQSIQRALAQVIEKFNRVDILINNAAINPKAEDKGQDSRNWTRLENYSLESWQKELAIGLTGAFICSQIIGAEFVRRGKGVILNIASDLALIGPDQRIYRQEGLAEDKQPVKPVTYSVIKAGLLGLTRYLATYWAEHGIRVNAISPGGVYNEQDSEFVKKLCRLIPLGRMAEADEYKAAVVFLVSDASSYMTGANLVIDGGRTCW